MADTSSTHDLAALARWMDGAGLPGTGDLPQLSRLGGGSQNELYIVTRPGHRSIMRIPPPGADAKRQDGLRRELTLLTALKGTDVPHGELAAGCPDRPLRHPPGNPRPAGLRPGRGVRAAVPGGLAGPRTGHVRPPGQLP
jgi:aminoglycoside phosphotransferase (APT) family kinase protein